RARRSALLTAGWLIPRVAAARVTLPSSMMASRTETRFKSTRTASPDDVAARLHEREQVARRSQEILAPTTAPAMFALFPWGRGHRGEFSKLGWVRGSGPCHTPHPFIFVEPLRSPLPQRERAPRRALHSQMGPRVAQRRLTPPLHHQRRQSTIHRQR